MDRILASLFGPGVVPVAVTPDRNTQVGFLDPPEHFLIQRLLHRPGRLEHGVGVAVLGLEIDADSRVVALAEPRELVDEGLAVVGRGDRARLG